MSRRAAQRGHRRILRSRPARQAKRLRPSLEPLESRQLLSTIDWIGPGTNWDTGSNWSGGNVPGPGDSAVIDTATPATITIQSGDNIQIQGITTSGTDTLSIAGGALTVTAGQSTLGGPLSMIAGSLTASGSGASLTANGSTTASGTSFYADSAATLSLPQMLSYTSDNSTFWAEGAGSVLDVSALANLTV